MSEAGAYRPEIDGLRALAVLPVVLFHTGFTRVSGGFVGVDVFFVISGYLITRIIHRELRDGSFSILHFYERRARRIVPALTVVMVAATLVAGLLMSPSQFVDYAKGLAATVLFASNFWFRSQIGGYFGIQVETQPLLHTWSLAVEEQFYIVFPLLLMVAVRFARQRTWMVIAALALASFALSEWQVHADRESAFYYPLPRAWELGLGALLALDVLPSLRSRIWREMLGWTAAALIIVPMLTYTRSVSFPGLAALPPCLGAAIILYLGTGENSVSRILSWRPIVFLGLISYSLYLWHWPIIVLLKGIYSTASLPLVVRVLVVAVAIVLATLSWRFVERPFRSRASVSKRTIFTLSLLSGASILACAGAIALCAGLPARFNEEQRLLIAGADDRNTRRGECEDRPGPTEPCAIGDPGAAPSAFFWGDSHGDAMQPGVEDALAHLGASGFATTKPGCAPLAGLRRSEPGCDEWTQDTLAFLERHAEIGVVILAARWPIWRTGAAFGDEWPPEETMVAGLAEDAALARPALFDRAAVRLVRTLRAMGKTVVIIGSVPEIGWSVPAKLFAENRFGAIHPVPPGLAVVSERGGPPDTLFESLAAADPAIVFVAVRPLLCAQTCDIVRSGKPLYYDDDHLSATAARTIIGPAIEPILARHLTRGVSR